MKKKIFVALGAIAIAVVLTFNVDLAVSRNGSGVDLSMMNSIATAQAEVDNLGPCSWSVKLCTGGCCLKCFEGGTTCVGDACNGHH